MKNKLAFICLLFLAFYSVSSAFAQDSTSIKIILHQIEEWKVDEVVISYFPPVLVEKYTDFSFDKIDSIKNIWVTKIPTDIRGA
jgi:hypothetical protein